jgi:ComF family protein
MAGESASKLLRVAGCVGRWTLDAVLPRLCPGCDEELSGRRWICGECRRRFEPVPAVPVCLACRAAARPRGDRRAGFDCRAREHGFYEVRGVFWLQPPLDRVVHALKYGGRRDLSRPLGALLGARTGAIVGDGVAAIPLHRTRRRERGFNQAALLAGVASTRWGIPFVEGVLVRSRATRAQAKTAEREREANVRGAFAAGDPAWVRGRRWVLVDDVATTGSTLLEGVRALERGGAAGAVSAVLALA